MILKIMPSAIVAILVCGMALFFIGSERPKSIPPYDGMIISIDNSTTTTTATLKEACATELDCPTKSKLPEAAGEVKHREVCLAR